MERLEHRYSWHSQQVPTRVCSWGSASGGKVLESVSEHTGARSGHESRLFRCRYSRRKPPKCVRWLERMPRSSPRKPGSIDLDWLFTQCERTKRCLQYAYSIKWVVFRNFGALQGICFCSMMFRRFATARLFGIPRPGGRLLDLAAVSGSSPLLLCW